MDNGRFVLETIDPEKANTYTFNIKISMANYSLVPPKVYIFEGVIRDCIVEKLDINTEDEFVENIKY
jgi:hypothetical protein